MTESEFFQKACIAMAGNPKFMEDIIDPHVISGNIIESALELTSMVCVRTGFDDCTINEELTDIHKTLRLSIKKPLW